MGGDGLLKAAQAEFYAVVHSPGGAPECHGFAIKQL